MPKYSPIDIGVPLQASHSDLDALHCSTNGIAADVVLSNGEDHLRRISFHSQRIIRILDEMLLSTEEGATPNEGLVPSTLHNHLEGAASARFSPVRERSERACNSASVRQRLGLYGRAHGCRSSVRRRAT
jgi:hypothetical protein